MPSQLSGSIDPAFTRKVVKAVGKGVFGVTHAILKRTPGATRCSACGARLVTITRPAIREPLISEWNIDSSWTGFFNQREGEICIACGASLRARQLGLALLHWLRSDRGIDGPSVRSVMAGAEVQALKIAEINACGALHKSLARNRNLLYSEFEPAEQDIRHEDILSLSYDDASLDVILHSDTIEHAPDFDRALLEIWRVLKQGGATIFSVPVVRDGRQTRTRAHVENGQIIHALPPSYHGGVTRQTDFLVFNEFGDDIKQRIEKAGFELSLHEHADNPAAVTFIARKH